MSTLNTIQRELSIFFDADLDDFIFDGIKDMRLSVSDEKYCTLEYTYGSSVRELKIGYSISEGKTQIEYCYGFALYENNRLSCFETYELHGVEQNLKRQIANLLNRLLRYPMLPVVESET